MAEFKFFRMRISRRNAKLSRQNYRNENSQTQFEIRARETISLHRKETHLQQPIIQLQIYVTFRVLEFSFL